MRHSFKKYFRNVDKVLFLSVMLLIAIGLVLIASATHANIPGPHRYRFVFRQALFVIVNLILGGSGIEPLDKSALPATIPAGCKWAWRRQWRRRPR